MLIKNILLILTTPLIVHSIELFGRYFYRCMNDNCSKLKLELNVKGMETLKVVLKSHHYRNFNETNCCFLSERKDRKYFVFFERCRENSRGLISDGHSEVMRIDPINHDTVSLRLFKLIDFYHELIRDEFKFKKINRDPIDTVNTTFGPVFNDPKRYPINLPIQGGYIETIVLYDSHFMEGKKQSTVMKTIQSSIKILIKWWARLGWFIVLKKIYFLNETFFDSNQHEGVPVIPKSALKESDYDLYIYFTKKYPSKSLHKTFGRICIESDQFIYSVILASFHENHLAIALDLFNRLAILMGIEYNTCIGNFDCRWQACTNSTDQFDLRSFYLLTKSAYYLSIIKQTNHPTCLLNKPDHQMAMCGNGIIENDEECDCILSDCEHCCIKCQLAKSGKQACGSGPCCNFKTCQLYHYHNYHVCRERLDVCDIPDVCDGRSSQCPPDAYVRDGTVCDNRNRSGYCFNGLCGTAEVQCNLLFNTSNGPVNCYTKNFQGTIPNNCGPTFGEVNQSNYLQCKGFDYLCGKLNCKLSKPDQLQNKLDWLFNSKVSVLKSGLNNPTYIEGNYQQIFRIFFLSLFPLC